MNLIKKDGAILQSNMTNRQKKIEYYKDKLQSIRHEHRHYLEQLINLLQEERNDRNRKAKQGH